MFCGWVTAVPAEHNFENRSCLNFKRITYNLKAIINILQGELNLHGKIYVTIMTTLITKKIINS